MYWGHSFYPPFSLSCIVMSCPPRMRELSLRLGEQLSADVSSWALQKVYLKKSLTGAVMSRFLKSPRRLAPNQSLGYFYPALWAPPAPPLWVALRGHVVLTHRTAAAQQTHSRTCKFSTQTIAHLDTFICNMMPQAKSVVKRFNFVGTQKGVYVCFFLSFVCGATQDLTFIPLDGGILQLRQRWNIGYFYNLMKHHI